MGGGGEEGGGGGEAGRIGVGGVRGGGGFEDRVGIGGGWDGDVLMGIAAVPNLQTQVLTSHLSIPTFLTGNFETRLPPPCSPLPCSRCTARKLCRCGQARVSAYRISSRSPERAGGGWP